MAARLPPVKRQENMATSMSSLQNRRSHFRTGTAALQLTCERRESLDLPKNPFGDTAFELPDPENRRHPRSCQMPETPDTAPLAFDHRAGKAPMMAK
mmetsp:Transcript_136052/g.322424  ORF Transcript_136052/g.322424 Transcript_136052/m.322424 type:complete len:97 (-) Transcript_136052:100-390(-)|eukprot:CAMPEP_0181473674 /NCGR_PEP_ID=MMETSP1110-20121109/40245_1 /TAXON_ID=174948 /ORGANISM="Symbiodinium sp., Strain CCMP421" /LENGTH=96 /DNA_ID=CAMNT_0023598797 /DNA_START=47 /DNA_END=337 /DNA_ORIENTATION=+